jgi:nucleoside-diphosphate-sugar epimerase
MIETIVITGGSGFIGTNLIALLGKELPELRLVNLDINPPREPAQRDYWLECDASDTQEVTSVLAASGSCQIVHLAARTDLDGRTLADYSINGVSGTNALLEAIRRAPNVERVLFASSRLVCRIGYTPSSDVDYCPPNHYGESKVAGELAVREATGLPTWAIIRPTSIWGPYFGTPYLEFFLACARGQYLHPSGRRVLKDFGYVENTAFQIMKLLMARPQAVNGQTFYLCDYQPIDVRSFAAEIAIVSDARLPREVPVAALWLAARFGDILASTGIYAHPPLTSFRLDNLMTDMTFNTVGLQGITGNLRFDQSEGIQRTVAYLRSIGAV